MRERGTAKVGGDDEIGGGGGKRNNKLKLTADANAQQQLAGIVLDHSPWANCLASGQSQTLLEILEVSMQ